MFAYIIEKLSNWFEAANASAVKPIWRRRAISFSSSSASVRWKPTVIRCNSARQHRVAHPVRKQRKAPY